MPGAGDTYPDRSFRIYVPDTVSTIRGVYLDLHGRGGDSRPIVNDESLRKLCEETGFALLGVHAVFPNYDAYYWNFGSYPISVLRALKDFAQLSGHSEIEFAPIFFDGYSQGAYFTFWFAWWRPEIAIGFIAQKSGADLQMEAAIGVPGFIIFGEFDRDRADRDLTPIFEKHRPQGALWSLAEEPGGDHDRITNRNLFDNFFRDVIELRLPTEITPNQPVTLNSIDESTGWLGDLSTFAIAEYDSFAGDKLQACWFPSEEVAQRWQSFVSGGNAGSRELLLQQSSLMNSPSSVSSLTVAMKASNNELTIGTSLSEADASFLGEAASDNSGYSVASAGDVNGDGFDDFLIGAAGQNRRRGKTYLFLGKTAADWG